ncbi:MAG TPA: DUF1345 domain-containing protein [Ohtaekwangia sp.]
MKIRALHRVIIALCFTAIAFPMVYTADVYPLVKYILLWDVFAVFFLLTSWIIFLHHSTTQIQKIVAQEDSSRFFLFLLIVIASLASMLTVILLVMSRDSFHNNHSIYLPAAIVGMLLSWAMVHTVFTFHYAHLYYDHRSVVMRNTRTKGLVFPGEQNPDYLDFAYFSFVIGMTFQVSDVNITSRKIRRNVFVHGLISFALNTFVVALTINLLAGNT